MSVTVNEQLVQAGEELGELILSAIKQYEEKLGVHVNQIKVVDGEIEVSFKVVDE